MDAVRQLGQPVLEVDGPAEGPRRRLQLFDEEAQVPLVGGDEPLDLLELLARPRRSSLQEMRQHLELEGRPGQGLEHAVVEVAGEPHPLVGHRRGPELAQQVELVELRGHALGHDLAEDQVVAFEVLAVEGEEPPLHDLAAHGPGGHPLDGEASPQVLAHRRAVPTLDPMLGANPGLRGAVREEARRRQLRGHQRRGGGRLPRPLHLAARA